MRTARLVNHERSGGISIGSFDQFSAQYVHILAAFIVLVDARPLSVWLHLDMPNANGLPCCDASARNAGRYVVCLQIIDLYAGSPSISAHALPHGLNGV